MKTYAEMKKWLEDHRKEFMLVGCFVLVFLSGFGLGKFQSESVKPKRSQQLNYTTQTSPEATGEVKGEQEKKTEAAPPPPAATPTGECVIKGNISSQGKKLYHIKGGAFYDRTNPEQCFDTEAQAKAAGFVKSSR